MIIIFLLTGSETIPRTKKAGFSTASHYWEPKPPLGAVSRAGGKSSHAEPYQSSAKSPQESPRITYYFDLPPEEIPSRGPVTMRRGPGRPPKAVVDFMSSPARKQRDPNRYNFRSRK